MGLSVRLIVYLGLISNFIIGQCVVSNNVVANGNFEAGNEGFVSDYTYNPGNLVPEATYDVLTNPNDDHNAFANCGDYTTGDGKMLVVNGSPQKNDRIWCQTVLVDQATDYNFSTFVTSVHPASAAKLQFSINGDSIGDTFEAPIAICSWNQFCVTWNSAMNTSAEICIINKNTAAQGNDFALDNIEMGASIGVLPVTLGRFEASNENADVRLNWTAYTEIDHDKYEIERSFDGISWKVIGHVNGKLQLGDTADYIFYDHLPQEGVNFYRLKIVAANKSYEYSDVRTVEHVFFSKFVDAYPNPMIDNINLKINTDLQDISVIDQLGKTVYFQKKPNNNQNISLPNLKSGTYFLEFKIASGKAYRKVLVKK